MVEFGYSGICALLRGMGDSKSPLAFAAVSSVLNICLDVAFVGPLGMGIEGAAAATVLSQVFSFLMAAWLFERRTAMVCSFLKKKRVKSAVKFSELWNTSWTIVKTGLPLTVQMLVLNLSYLTVTGMMNSHGVSVAAAAGIGLRINTMAVMPCWAIGQGVSTMVGQNMGAGDTVRVGESVKTGLLIALIITGVTMLSIQFWTREILSFFTNDIDVLEKGVTYLKICCSVNILFYAVMFVFDSFASGLGDTLFAMGNSLWHSVAMRLALSWLFSLAMGYGYIGLFWGESLSPLMSCIIGCIYFYSGKWKEKKLISS